MIEYGDLVHDARRRSVRYPETIRGRVIKVTAKFAIVQWKRPNRRLVWWNNYRQLNSDDLPATSKIAHASLALVERRGGPW